MAKPAKPEPAETDEPQKPKSKKLLLILIALVLVGAIGGGAWFFLKSGDHKEEHKEAVVPPPTFMELEPFTLNLQREENDQFLQIGLTLQVSNMALADKLRQRLPEVRSRLLFLLSSKRASELLTTKGKKKLAKEIRAKTNSVIGLGKPSTHDSGATPGEEAVAHEDTPEYGSAKGDGVQDVLFTSFIIQ